MNNYESIMKCLNPAFLPTPEQREVIESDSAGILVVAGAGSGKTATMANRIAYKIATGVVGPSEVLGLTFTRKAAGELADRVDQALTRLRRAGYLGTEGNDVAALREQLDRPTITTYNSFAAEISASYGMLIGADPSARLITEAERWQIMQEIVENWPRREEDAELREKAQSTLITYSLSLAAALIDNHRTTDEAREFFDTELAAIERFNQGKGTFKTQEGRNLGGAWRDLRDKGAKSMRLRRSLLDFVDAYYARKKELGVTEFADQVATAAAVLSTYPALGQDLAGRFRLVLLDEYQDTSVNQADFLAQALAPRVSGEGTGDAPDSLPRSVCAVGDPYQAIYGWRGASASALADFDRDFGRRLGGMQRLSLATSFRNDQAILDAANAVAKKIGADSLPVAKLDSREDAGPGTVTEIRPLLREDSYRAIAWRIRDVMAAKAASGGGAEIAVLCRKRKYIETMVEALTEVGVPYEIVGGESLLQRPEILTIRAALTSVAAPGRNDQLIRLLTFAGVGPADLRVLSSWSREYASRQLSRVSESEAAASPEHKLSARGEGTLVEALTYLPKPDWQDRDGRGFTTVGRERLEHLAGLLARIRSVIHSDLSDLIAHVARIFGLELASATRTSGSQRVRTSIDSFINLGGNYQHEHPGSSLQDFLTWLEASDEKEHGGEDEAGIESARVDEDIEVRPDVVQIMTIHSAKGLEWSDLVVIPEVVDGEFSDIEKGAKSWVSRGEMFPFPLRADYEHLPHFQPSQCEDKFEAAEKIEEFKKVALPEYESQETRRLAYVAFTRPRAELVLAGYGLKSPDKAQPKDKGQSQNIVTEDPLTVSLKHRSSYVTDIRAEALADPPKASITPIAQLATDQWPKELTEEVGEQAEVAWLTSRLGEEAVNPPALAPVPHYADHPELARWPQAVHRSLGELAPVDTDAGPDEWQWQARVLLAEAEEQATSSSTRPYYTATDMVHLAEDSETFLANQRRPIPSQPSRAARLGTNMHAQIAHHFTEPATLDVDTLFDVPSLDVDMGAADQDRLYEAFLASPWASCEPLAIEQSLEIVVAGHIVRCTIDAVLDTSAMPGRKPVTIIDWKTGTRPRAKDVPSRELQLALYRLAWSRAHKLPLSQIGACFVYLNEPESRRELEAGELSEEEITKRIAQALSE